MIIGVPKEIKDGENRVAITPAGVMALSSAGHRVLVEQGAGAGSGFADADYQQAGAAVLGQADDVWSQADVVLKVKEPLAEEYRHFRPGLTLFTYLHLAAAPALAEALVQSGVTAIAYETVQVGRSLPLLAPMSEIAGKMATQVGAQLLERSRGGKGVLLGGVPGVGRGRVVIVGGGTVGTNAAKIAVGLGADVTVLDVDIDRLRQLEELFDGRIHTLVSNAYNIRRAIAAADLAIGAVLIPGARAPVLVPEEAVAQMEPGSVVVDVAIDQGGIFATSDHVTTHDNPTYVRHGVIHYAVANMPGEVPRTSTIALTNATMPYVLELAGKGVRAAVQSSEPLQRGVNVAGGAVTNEQVARDLGYAYVPVESALA